MEKNSGLEQAIEAYMSDRGSEVSQPLSPDELLAYRDGALTESERASAVTRLSADRAGVRALLDLEAIGEGSDEGETAAIGPDVLETAWSELNARLDAEAREPQAVVRAAFLPGRVWRLGAVLPLAACFVLAFWSLSLQRELTANRLAETLPSLEGDDVTVRLSDTNVRGGGGALLVLRSERRSFLFELPHGWRDFPAYGVEIIDEKEAGKPLFDLSLDGPRESMTLGLALAFFPRPDSFRIVIYGMRDDRRQDLADIELVVEF